MESLDKILKWVGILDDNKPEANKKNSSTDKSYLKNKIIRNMNSILKLHLLSGTKPENLSKSANPSLIKNKSPKKTQRLSPRNESKIEDTIDQAPKIPTEDTIENNLYEKFQSSAKLDSCSLTILIQSFCIKCGSHKEITAFLCNHNVCKMCLSTYCCEEIIYYCNRVNNSTGASMKFNYHCLDCGKIISLPTRMVIRYYLEKCGTRIDPQTKVNLNYILENCVPFFDGIMMEGNL